LSPPPTIQASRPAPAGAGVTEAAVLHVRSLVVRLRQVMLHWARVAVLNDPKYHGRYEAFRARGHSYGRALRGVAERLLGVACVLLQRQTLFDAEHGTPVVPPWASAVPWLAWSRQPFVPACPRPSTARKRRPGCCAGAPAPRAGARRQPGL